jgi:hypothetical protein
MILPLRAIINTLFLICKDILPYGLHALAGYDNGGYVLYYSITNFHERRSTMTALIVWETDMKKAIARAKSENKPILFRYRRRFIGQYQF